MDNDRNFGSAVAIRRRMRGEINVVDIAKMDLNELIKNLVSWGALQAHHTCTKCGSQMKIREDTADVDGKRFYCGSKIYVPKKKAKCCNYRLQFRHGTFFARSHLSLQEVAMFVNLWADNAPLQLIEKTTRICIKTAVDWGSFCREVVFDAVTNHSEPIGGEGQTVEIDESKFGKRKYHRGHQIEGQWVFGGIERESGRCFMVLLNNFYGFHSCLFKCLLSFFS